MLAFFPFFRPSSSSSSSFLLLLLVLVHLLYGFVFSFSASVVSAQPEFYPCAILLVSFFWLSSIVHITSHIFCCFSILLIVKHRPHYITHILLFFYSSDCQASSTLHHTYSAVFLFFWLSSIVHVTSHIFCCSFILLIVKHRPHYITHILLLFYSDCQASSAFHHTYSAAFLFWLSSIVHITSHIFCCFSILLIVEHSPCYITHILLLFYSSDCRA